MIIMVIMVIFKRLSLKALSALQDHEGGGGTGQQNNDTNVSLRLYVLLHQYINAKSHPLHTHALPPPSPFQSIHTHTHHAYLHIANQTDIS